MSVANQVGDFMLLGKQESSQVAVLPQLQSTKHNNFHNYGGQTEEPTALSLQNVGGYTKA